MEETELQWRIARILANAADNTTRPTEMLNVAKHICEEFNWHCSYSPVTHKYIFTHHGYSTNK